MSAEEKQALKDKKVKFYKKEFWRVILEIVPVDKPVWPINELIGNQGIQEAVNAISEDKSTRVYLWMDYVKPGKN